MFDFQKLKVYTKARDFNHELQKITAGHDLEDYSSIQLSECACGIMLNIARGTAQSSPLVRSACFTDARTSVHECAVILDYLLNTKQFEQGPHDQLIEPLNALSKMLYALSLKTSELPEKRVKKAEPVDS